MRQTAVRREVMMGVEFRQGCSHTGAVHFLVQSPHAWQGIRQRPHHLMARFAAAGHEVTWVQPRYLKWLAGEGARFRQTRDEQPLPGVRVRTVTLLNGERFAPVRARNRATMARRFPAPSDAEARVLWLYNPHEGHLADRVPHDLLIYDMMDEYRGFPWSPPQIEAEEAELLARADWIFAGTDALYEARRPAVAEKIECILSGVEAGHFAKAQGGALPSPNVPLQGPVLGYAGMLDLRIDLELLEKILRHTPASLLLLGPRAAGFGSLPASGRLHAAGPVAYADLPAWYGRFDLALLPFVENELTRHVNPTKMLEYAAAGVPIVARALPEVKKFYARGAWLYETHAEAIELIQKLLGDPALARTRLEAARGWARARDWDTLARRMLERVEQLLKR